MAMLKIHPADNVAVLLDPIRSGETLTAATIAVTATAAIEQGHKIGEIRQGPRQAINLVDHDDIDQSLANILEQALHARPLHPSQKYRFSGNKG